MSIPQVLEAALGMALTYYLLGLIVSWISQFVMDTFETRGKTLEGYLRRIVGSKSMGKLLSMPQIRSLAAVRPQGWLGFLTRKLTVVEKKVEKIPATNLVDAFFDLTQLDLAENGEEVVATVNKLPPSEGKTELLRLINSGVTHSADLRAKMGLWFDGLMDQSAAVFKAFARRYVFFFALLITLIFGVDSLDLFQQLWNSPDMRAIAAVKAQAYIAQNGYDADTGPLLADLEGLTIQLGWASVLKNMPPQAATLDFVKFWLWKFLGLLITAVAVSKGAPFWYDILRKVTEAKSPETRPSRGSEDNFSGPVGPETGAGGYR